MRRGNLTRWLAAAMGVLLAGGWFLGAAGSRAGLASPQVERLRQSAQFVEEAARQESLGNDAERNRLLERALAESPDFAPARWHSGYVRDRGGWRKFDETPEATAGDGRRGAYERVRAEQPDTVEGHLALARWCAGRRMPDQQRAHLTRVLDLQPDHAEARRLLGYAAVGGTWMTAEETAAARREVERTAAAMRAWGPRLVEIRDALAHRSADRRQAARQRLLAIDDPDALAAMQAILGGHDEETAAVLIEALGRMPGAEASRALATQAVFSPWETVRAAAAEQLRGRDPHAYAPQLLAAMNAPVQSRAQLFRAPNGNLSYAHVLFREGQYADQLAMFHTEYLKTLVGGVASIVELERMRQEDAARKALLREMAIAQHNALVEQLNDRISETLAAATGERFASTAEQWWKWWNDYNETYLADDKPVARFYFRDEVKFDDPYGNDPGYSSGGSGGGGSSGGPPTVYECLAAGTPVWTDAGWKPIEEMRVGDRVLAKDPKTGELAYKPVLRTTVRPAAPLMRVELDGQTISSSGGHPFWVAGEGWIKARELRPGMFLHAVAGAVEVRAAESSGDERTYNLIVADFHSYFVGPRMILSHDNTLRDPTDAILPGLHGRNR